MTDDEIRKAAEDLVEAEIADEAALAELERAVGDERALVMRRKEKAMRKRDEALARLASLLGKKWPLLLLRC